MSSEVSFQRSATIPAPAELQQQRSPLLSAPGPTKDSLSNSQTKTSSCIIRFFRWIADTFSRCIAYFKKKTQKQELAPLIKLKDEFFTPTEAPKAVSIYPTPKAPHAVAIKIPAPAKVVPLAKPAAPQEEKALPAAPLELPAAIPRATTAPDVTDKAVAATPSQPAFVQPAISMPVYQAPVFQPQSIYSQEELQARAKLEVWSKGVKSGFTSMYNRDLKNYILRLYDLGRDLPITEAFNPQNAFERSQRDPYARKPQLDPMATKQVVPYTLIQTINEESNKLIQGVEQLVASMPKEGNTEAANAIRNDTWRSIHSQYLDIFQSLMRTKERITQLDYDKLTFEQTLTKLNQKMLDFCYKNHSRLNKASRS